ncbi:hypothetical protein Hanom_Chr14g01298031 [Helianthus anomalus]
MYILYPQILSHDSISCQTNRSTVIFMDINSSPMTHWNQKRTYQGTNSNRLTKLILRYNYTIPFV